MSNSIGGGITEEFIANEFQSLVLNVLYGTIFNRRRCEERSDEAI